MTTGIALCTALRKHSSGTVFISIIFIIIKGASLAISHWNALFQSPPSNFQLKVYLFTLQIYLLYPLQREKKVIRIYNTQPPKKPHNLTY